MAGREVMPRDRYGFTGESERSGSVSPGGHGVVWSPAAMTERLGGDEVLARQLVILFLGEYEKLLANLRRSMTTGRADDVRRAAHAAKGCIANFIDGGPQDTAYRIEQLGANGELAAVPPLVARLEDEVATLVEQMQAFERETSCAS
jgi:HPt (histidine-containing phosphotransfer) domain-containing protein